MSLKDIFKEVCAKLEDVNGISKKFANLTTDEERFALTYDLCSCYISSLHFESLSKSSEKSEKTRKIGNEKFVGNIHWEALKLYNESIALAPNNSNELALGYGNRAACLLSLHFGQEALEDVEQSLKLPVTDDFKNKLLTRKEKCLNEINNNISNTSCFFGSGDLVPLSQGKSSILNSASKLIGLTYDQYFERQLVAEDDIKTGEVLLVEKPYSSILLPDHYYTYCTNCYKRSLTLFPCDNCSRAMFCSKECETNSYKMFHNIECNILDILVKLKVERMQLLSLRILIQASNSGEKLEGLFEKITKLTENKINTDCYESLDFVNIYNLVTNTNKRKNPDLFYRAVVSTIFIILLEKYTNFFKFTSEGNKNMLRVFSGGLILRFMQNMPCNAHEISEFCIDELKEVGAGAYSTFSLINHSCDPNVVRFSCNDFIILRSIRPIKKGEQIFDNYGYHYATHSIEERQKALMNQYFFKCGCEPCLNLWPMYENIPEEPLIEKKKLDMKLYQKLTDKFEKNLNKILNGTFDHKVIEENFKYLDFLDEFVERPWKNYNKCQETIKHCLNFYGNHFTFSKGVASSG